MIHSSTPKKASRTITLLGLGLAAMLMVITVLLSSSSAAASSHREAPLISKDPFADNTDTYAWVPEGQTDNVALAAAWIPFEGPEGGPNYFEWDDQAQYHIHVDNDGDAAPDLTYTLQSTTVIRDPLNTFLYNVGPIDSPDSTNWNRYQTYDLTLTDENGTTLLCDDCFAPPVNIGSKSTPDFESLVQAATYDLPGGGKVYAGQTDDPFFVDLQVFDLLTLRGQAPPIGYSTGTNIPVDALAGFNVHSLVIEVPIANVTDGDSVIGVWSTTTREGASVFDNGADPAVQVSRLGMPLVNEVVIPMGAKDIFNGLAPENDLAVYIDQGAFAGLLQEAVENPEVGTLLCALYGVPLPEDSDNDCNTEYTPTDGAGVGAGSGRGDIFQIFLTGITIPDGKSFTIETANGPVTLDGPFNVNTPANVQPAEMIRLNTAISGGLCHPTPQRLGVLAGDACGFPNGRRPMDDTVEIALLAVAGATYELLDDEDDTFSFNPALIGVLTDGIDANDVPFHGQSSTRDIATFPYFATAQSGQSHLHTNGTASNTTVQLGSMFGGTATMPLLEIGIALLVLTGFVMVVYTRRYNN